MTSCAKKRAFDRSTLLSIQWIFYAFENYKQIKLFVCLFFVCEDKIGEVSSFNSLSVIVRADSHSEQFIQLHAVLPIHCFRLWASGGLTQPVTVCTPLLFVRPLNNTFHIISLIASLQHTSYRASETQSGLESTFSSPDVGDISQTIQASHRRAKSSRDRSQRGNYTRNKSQFVCFFFSMQA